MSDLLDTPRLTASTRTPCLRLTHNVMYGTNNSCFPFKEREIECSSLQRLQAVILQPHLDREVSWCLEKRQTQAAQQSGGTGHRVI